MPPDATVRAPRTKTKGIMDQSNEKPKSNARRSQGAGAPRGARTSQAPAKAEATVKVDAEMSAPVGNLYSSEAAPKNRSRSRRRVRGNGSSKPQASAGNFSTISCNSNGNGGGTSGLFDGVPKIVRYIIITIITAVVLALMWYFNHVVAYILIAAVLAIIGKPLVDLLEKMRIRGHHIPRAIASALTLIAIWGCIVAVMALFIPVIFDKMNEISDLNISQFISSIQEPLSRAELYLKDTFHIESSDFSLTSALMKQLSPIFNVNMLNNMLTGVVSTIVEFFIGAFSVSFIMFFFLKDENLFRNMIVVVMPQKYEQSINRAMDSITTLLIRYFTGIVAESSIMVVIVSVLLLILGLSVENALIIGLIVGILNVIPYIGPIIGMALGLLIGLLSPMASISLMSMAIRIAATVLFAQGVDNMIIQPLLYSNRAKAHPLEIFLVILIAGSIGGVWGMLLAIPAYNVMRVIAKEFFNNLRVVQKLTSKI